MTASRRFITRRSNFAGRTPSKVRESSGRQHNQWQAQRCKTDGFCLRGFWRLCAGGWGKNLEGTELCKKTCPTDPSHPSLPGNITTRLVYPACEIRHQLWPMVLQGRLWTLPARPLTVRQSIFMRKLKMWKFCIFHFCSGQIHFVENRFQPAMPYFLFIPFFVLARRFLHLRSWSTCFLVGLAFVDAPPNKLKQQNRVKGFCWHSRTSWGTPVLRADRNVEFQDHPKLAMREDGCLFYVNPTATQTYFTTKIICRSHPQMCDARPVWGRKQPGNL